MVLRLNARGPEDKGLEQLKLDPADFQSELPEQNWHIYFEDEAAGLYVGVWTTTDMQEVFGPYPGNEFMALLEGNVALVDKDGNETIIKQGETFCVRNGIPISWKQVGFARKFFVIFAPPESENVTLETSDGGIKILRPDELSTALEPLETTDPFQISGDLPVQNDANAFNDDSGRMICGMWQSSEFESDMAPFPAHELVQLLEGKITISQPDAEPQTFSGGDVFFIPKGTICSWKVTEPVKKLYCIVDC